MMMMTTKIPRLGRNLPKSTRGRALAASGVLACLLAAGATGLLATAAAPDGPGQTSKGGDDRPIIDVERKGPIKVAFEIATPETKEGVSKGLFYLKKVHAMYLAAGFDPAQLDIRGVFHGEGAEPLLTDDAWNRVRNEAGGNPNTALISELARIGVHVELCNNTRVKKGWAMSDVHPDVQLVKSAYLRLIDLQQSGYAYIWL